MTPPAPIKITLADAPRLATILAEAPDGAVLELGQGLYRCTEPIALHRAVTLTGEGMGLTRLMRVFATSEPLLVYGGSGVLGLEHLSFEDPEHSGPLVVCRSGEMRLEKCRFMGSHTNPRTGTTVGFRFSGASRGQGIGCLFEDLSVGAEFAEQSSASVTAGRFRRGGCGASLEGHAKAIFSACSFEGQIRDGVSVADDATAEVEADNTFERGAAGVGVGDRGSAVVTSCTFRVHKRAGVWAEDRARVRVLSSVFEDNALGVTLTDQARGLVEGNTITGGGCGVTIVSKGAVEVVSNIITEASEYGLKAEGESSPTVKGNTFEGCIRAGMWFREASSGHVEKNTARDNPSGLVLTESVSPLVARNTFETNQHHGILVRHRASPSLSANTCTDNGRNGIAIKGESRPRVSGNRVRGSKVGILVGGLTACELIQNTCRENEEFGIRFTDNAAGQAEGNTCEANKHGVGVTDSSRPVLRRNICRDNSESGIVVWDAAAGLIEGNICRGSPVGVGVMYGSQPVLRDNLCSNNGENYVLPENIAQDTRAIVPVRAIPRRARQLVEPHMALRAIDMAPGVGASLLFGVLTVAGFLIAGWSLGMAFFLCACFTLLWTLSTAGKDRRRLLAHGLLLEGEVVASESESKLVTIVWEDAQGRRQTRQVGAPGELFPLHAVGTEVPVITHPWQTHKVIFPSIEQIRFLPPPEVEDTRPPRPQGGSTDARSPEPGWTHTCKLFTQPPTSDTAPSLGMLELSEVMISTRRGAQAPTALDLSRPFVMHLTVWLVSGDEGELCVSIRPRGGVEGLEVSFSVELPQSRLSRDIPRQQRSAQFVSAKDFDVIWPVLRHLAQIHGVDPGGVV